MWVARFALKKPSPVDAGYSFSTGRVHVTMHSSEIVAEEVSVASYKDAQKKALELCNLFLDQLSAEGHADLEVKAVECRLETTDPNGQVHISVTPDAEVICLTERIIVVKRDSSGKVIEFSDSNKPVIKSVKHTDAKSYYRKAKLSEDAFEAFRNFYLVAENVADGIRLQKGLGKIREQELLRQGLEECFRGKVDSLKHKTVSVHGAAMGVDICAGVAETLYKGDRCRLNHSKLMQQKRVPFNPSDEDQVKKALPLIEYVAKSFLDYEASLP
jgi:hypothetical protein